MFDQLRVDRLALGVEIDVDHVRWRTNFSQPEEPIIQGTARQMQTSTGHVVGGKEPFGDLVNALRLVGWNRIFYLIGHFHENWPTMMRKSNFLKSTTFADKGMPTKCQTRLFASIHHPTYI